MTDVVKVYRPSPIVERLLTSTQPYRLIYSSVGEGKSVACLMAAVVHAMRCPSEVRPLKLAYIRDTRHNLGLTTVPSIKEWFPPGSGSRWVGKELTPEACTLMMKDGPAVQAFFIGCDTPDDLSNLQGLELDIAIFEEPAPAATISGGISEDVWALVVTRLRGRAGKPLVLIAMNPPDEKHWTAWLFGLPGCSPPDAWDDARERAVQRVRAQSEVVWIPPGDNVALTQRNPRYRQDAEEALGAIGRLDLVARIIGGRVGTVQVGAPVASDYLPAHAVEGLQVQRGDSLICSWDPRANPSMVLWRPIPGSYCDIVAAFQVINQGVQQLLQQTVLPWWALHGPSGCTMVHTGDPTTIAPDQSNSARNAVQAILRALPGRWERGPKGIDDRREPMHEVLRRMHGGRPWVRIDKTHAQVLCEALAGGFYYPKDTTGRIIRERWVKNSQSDIGEAFMYGCAFLTKQQTVESTMTRWRAKVAQMARERRQEVGNHV